MKRLLVVVDMQHDFIDGALGTMEAVQIVPNVIEKIKQHEGPIIATRDTHDSDYLDTQEGRNLPVVHCVKDTYGWQLQDDIAMLVEEREGRIIDKPSFGSVEVGEVISGMFDKGEIDEVEFVGLCTDICVISNSMIVKAYAKELPVYVDASCCAGVTKESHCNALEAMKMCQIVIE